MTNTEAQLANALMEAARRLLQGVLADLEISDRTTFAAVRDLAEAGAVFKVFAAATSSGSREVGIEVVTTDGETTRLMTVADRALDS